MAQKHGVLALCAARAALGSLESPGVIGMERKAKLPCVAGGTLFNLLKLIHVSPKNRLYKNLLPSPC